MTITIEANENRLEVQFIKEQAQKRGQAFQEFLGKYIIDAIHEKVLREATAQGKAEETAWIANHHGKGERHA